MKQFNFPNYILLLALTFISSSCTYSHYKYVTVRGIPGTSIYTPQKKQVGTIGPDGTSEMSLHCGTCYYLSKAPGSNLYVPFAVDVRDGGLDDAELGIRIGYMFIFPAPIIAIIQAACQADKPIKNQMTNNDHFAEYEELYALFNTTKSAAITDQNKAIRTSQNAPLFYCVANGETLDQIAKKFGVSVEQLCQLNGISATTNLHGGQTLKIR